MSKGKWLGVSERSVRELEALSLVGLGLQNWEIALRMGIQPASVEGYFTSIRQKYESLGITVPSHRGGLVRWAIEQGYAPLTPQGVVF